MNQVQQSVTGDNFLGLGTLIVNRLDGIVGDAVFSSTHRMISYGFYFFILVSLLSIILAIVGIVQESGNGSSEPAYLMGLTGDFSGARLKIGSGITIGRDPAQCQLILNSEYVSRKHCQIIYNDLIDKYVITDYSSNGIYLENGEKLPHNSPTMLDKGMVIILGKDGDRFELK